MCARVFVFVLINSILDKMQIEISCIAPSVRCDRAFNRTLCVQIVRIDTLHYSDTNTQQYANGIDNLNDITLNNAVINSFIDYYNFNCNFYIFFCCNRKLIFEFSVFASTLAKLFRIFIGYDK